jgi:hypothetical protein
VLCISWATCPVFGGEVFKGVLIYHSSSGTMRNKAMEEEGLEASIGLHIQRALTTLDFRSPFSIYLSEVGAI